MVPPASTKAFGFTNTVTVAVALLLHLTPPPPGGRGLGGEILNVHFSITRSGPHSPMVHVNLEAVTKTNQSPHSLTCLPAHHQAFRDGTFKLGVSST